MLKPAPKQFDSTIASEVGGSWAFTSLLVVFSWFLGTRYQEEGRTTDLLALIPLLLFAILALAYAVFTTVLAVHFGKARLALRCKPAPGQALEGTLTIHQTMEHVHSATATLTLQHRIRKPRWPDGKRIVEITDRWTETVPIPLRDLRPAKADTQVLLHIPVPDDVSLQHDGGKMRWRLQVTVDQEGLPFDQQFYLPATPAKRPIAP